MVTVVQYSVVEANCAFSFSQRHIVWVDVMKLVESDIFCQIAVDSWMGLETVDCCACPTVSPDADGVSSHIRADVDKGVSRTQKFQKKLNILFEPKLLSEQPQSQRDTGWKRMKIRAIETNLETLLEG